MTLQQEAMQIISRMPDENLRVIIDLLHIMQPQDPSNKSSRKMAALKWMQDRHKEMPDGAYADLDIERELEEALTQKYGSID